MTRPASPVTPRLPVRDRRGHKGEYGHVLVVAGCRGYTGAAYLASQAALRTGSGLVTLVVPAAIYPILAVKLTEVIVVPVRDTTAGTIGAGAVAQITQLAEQADVLAVGPGLSTNRHTGAMLRALLPRVRRPIVLDADGLNLLAREPLLWKRRHGASPWVLTPHPREMGRLAGLTVAAVPADRRAVAERFARQHRVVVVLKGHGTVVTDGRRTTINATGNPGMATAGAGDVLTGMIASLIGQGLSPFDAAALGVLLHGLAGDVAAAEQGEIGLIASDILSKIPSAVLTAQSPRVARRRRTV